LPDGAKGIFLREGLDILLVICPSCQFVARIAITSSLRSNTTRAPELDQRRRKQSMARLVETWIALQQNYLRSDCLAGGPLLLPGRPFMFDVSCVWSDGFCWFAPAAEPTVSPGLAAGPFLFPGWPAIPAPEFGALGAVETPGFVVCASAAGADIASARMAMLNILFMTSPRKLILWQAESIGWQA
jgi:hypothetical protein